MLEFIVFMINLCPFLVDTVDGYYIGRNVFNVVIYPIKCSDGAKHENVCVVLEQAKLFHRFYLRRNVNMHFLQFMLVKLYKNRIISLKALFLIKELDLITNDLRI